MTEVMEVEYAGSERKRIGGRRSRTGVSQFTGGGYISQSRNISEEWDKLVQNPFLAFYQRWPWFAHHTPLLNLWNPAAT